MRRTQKFYAGYRPPLSLKQARALHVLQSNTPGINTKKSVKQQALRR